MHTTHTHTHTQTRTLSSLSLHTHTHTHTHTHNYTITHFSSFIYILPSGIPLSLSLSLHLSIYLSLTFPYISLCLFSLPLSLSSHRPSLTHVLMHGTLSYTSSMNQPFPAFVIHICTYLSPKTSSATNSSMKNTAILNGSKLQSMYTV